MPALQNTWLLALALVAISVKSSAATSAYEVEGDIERQYVRPDGEWGTSTNWFQVSVSGCKASIRTGGMSDKAVNYFEYVADGTNSALLISYIPAEEVSMAGGVDNGRV
jgi:hypothetical protein